jgi:hypothetical protein
MVISKGGPNRPWAGPFNTVLPGFPICRANHADYGRVRTTPIAGWAQEGDRVGGWRVVIFPARAVSGL